MTEVVHEGVVVPEGVAVHEELVVHDGVVAHDPGRGQSRTGPFEADTQSRTGWQYRERWAGLGLAALIASLTGCAARQPDVGGARLVGLTATISAVWFIGLRRSARFAQERELKPSSRR